MRTGCSRSRARREAYESRGHHPGKHVFNLPHYSDGDMTNWKAAFRSGCAAPVRGRLTPTTTEVERASWAPARRRAPSGRSALGALIRMQPRPPDAAWLSYQAQCTHCLLAAIHAASTRLHAASAHPDTASATTCGERTISCGERTRPPCVRSVKDAREMTGRADVIRLHIATQYTERIAPTTNLMKRTGCGSPRSNSS